MSDEPVLGLVLDCQDPAALAAFWGPARPSRQPPASADRKNTVSPGTSAVSPSWVI